MDTTFGIVLPVFGVVLAGYLVGRTRLLTREGIRGLVNFVFYLAIPALLFRSLGRGTWLEALDPGLILAYSGGGLLLYLAAALFGRLVFGLTLAERALLAMGAVFSNGVLLGIPLILTAFGEAALVPLMMVITMDSALIPLTMVLIEIERGAGGGRGRIFRTTVLALARNPVIVAMVAGLAFGASGLALPTPVDRFTELLGRAAAPCALFALGATLTTFRLTGNLRQSATLASLKLVAHPLLVWLLTTRVVPLDPTWAAVATVTAALPVGANVFILAQQYDVYLARATTAILISTAASVVTIAVLLAILAP